MKRKEDYDKEEIQKKIKLAKEKLAAKTVVSIQQKIENSLKAQKEEEKMQKGGLKVAYHPALLAMNQGKYTSKYEKILPKHSDILANKKATVKVQENPYLTEKDSFRKRSREIKFNEPGKYIQIAEDKRNAEKLEALKKEIAETARKAGLERELELVSNKAIRVMKDLK
jgi:U4/U6 small nuclear ribonucleoprotein PRP3